MHKFQQMTQVRKILMSTLILDRVLRCVMDEQDQDTTSSSALPACPVAMGPMPNSDGSMACAAGSSS